MSRHKCSGPPCSSCHLDGVSSGSAIIAWGRAVGELGAHRPEREALSAWQTRISARATEIERTIHARSAGGRAWAAVAK